MTECFGTNSQSASFAAMHSASLQLSAALKKFASDDE
jgi:hypothetical protein